MEEKMEYLRRVFHSAQLRGLCRTQKEFADLLGINDKGLSAAMNGNAKFLTESLIRKVEMFSFREGLETESQAPKKREMMEIPVDFKQMLDNMSEVLASQSRLLESQARMLELYQQQTAAPHTAPAEKIFTDGSRR